jgi:hypothetical protein
VDWKITVSCCKEKNPIISKVNNLVKKGKVQQARKIVKKLVEKDLLNLTK